MSLETNAVAHAHHEATLILADALFRAAWVLLSSLGFCDSCGGAEFTRVMRAWVEAERPSDAHQFIRVEAHRRPH